MVAADCQDLHTDLAQALQEFWNDYTGARPTCVQVVASEQAILVPRLPSFLLLSWLMSKMNRLN
jgi:hypothetical protein